MEDNNINIAFAVDNNFVQQLATTIVSILRSSNKQDKFNFYVLDGGISPYNKEKVEKLKSIKHFNIEYLVINNDDFKHCPIPESLYFTKATYYRFKLQSLVSIDKILYMDCDILVRKSLSELYSVDVENKYAAVVEDMMFTVGKLGERCSTLGVSRYFNAGIMVLNLKKMREDNIEAKCFEFVEKTPEKVKWVDQCVLNSIFEEKVKFIDKKYNFQYQGWLKEVREMYKQVENDIIILHYVGFDKPWLLERKTVLRPVYLNCLLKTPYGYDFILKSTKGIGHFICITLIRKLFLTFKLGNYLYL